MSKAFTEAHKEKAKEAGLAIAKGAIGLLPGGSIAAELIGIVIPNKRMDRVEEMLSLFGEKVKDVEEAKLHQRMREPDFEELFEQGCYLAAQSIAKQKIKAIASVLHRGARALESTPGLKEILSIYERLTELDIVILLGITEKIEAAHDKVSDFGLQIEHNGEFALHAYSSVDSCVQYANQWLKNGEFNSPRAKDNTMSSLKRLENESLIAQYKIEYSNDYENKSQTLFLYTALGKSTIFNLKDFA